MSVECFGKLSQTIIIVDTQEVLSLSILLSVNLIDENM